MVSRGSAGGLHIPPQLGQQPQENMAYLATATPPQ